MGVVEKDLDMEEINWMMGPGSFHECTSVLEAMYILRLVSTKFQGLLRGVLHARPKVMSSGRGPWPFVSDSRGAEREAARTPWPPPGGIAR